jgi:hypothetical protein
MLAAGGVPEPELGRIVDVWLGCVRSLGFTQPGSGKGKVRPLDCVALLSGVIRLFFADVGGRGSCANFEKVAQLPAEIMVGLMGGGDFYGNEFDQPE